MHYLAFTLFAFSFTWFMVTARHPRRVLTVAVAGILVAALLVAPTAAEAQAGIIQLIQTVLNVIQGVVQQALSAMETVRGEISALYQTLIWPVALIQQSKALVAQMIRQYRALMAGILRLNLRSATLPPPQALETIVRDHQVNNFGALSGWFATAYGAIPNAGDATQADREMSDLDDALVLDSLKTLKISDNITDLEFEGASAMEDSASQAAPGSAGLLTASAVVSDIRSQAVTQKMLAAELRQEAAHLAHQNGLRKRGAAFTTQMRSLVINLLQHN